MEYHFEKLKVWQMGMKLVERIYSLTREFPREEQFGMIAQLRRAVVSVPVNIEQAVVEEELDLVIEQSSKEPIEHYQVQLSEKKKKALRINIEKQEGLYQVFREDKINLELYKEKAEELRREERLLKAEISQFQMSLLDRERGVEQRLKTQLFFVNGNYFQLLEIVSIDWETKPLQRFHKSPTGDNAIFQLLPVHEETA